MEEKRYYEEPVVIKVEFNSSDVAMSSGCGATGTETDDHPYCLV